MKKIEIALLSAGLLLAGCATPYVAPGPVSSTSLSLHVNNEFKSFMLMKGAHATTYANPQCEKPQLLGVRTVMNDQDSLPPVHIPFGQAFVFGIRTSDASPTTRNTGCSVTAIFTPVENESYKAVLSTKDDKTCSLVLTDKNNTNVPFTMPEYSCDVTMGGIVRNGTGYFYNPR